MIRAELLRRVVGNAYVKRLTECHRAGMGDADARESATLEAQVAARLAGRVDAASLITGTLTLVEVAGRIS